jgi:hypothetical protein
MITIRSPNAAAIMRIRAKNLVIPLLPMKSRFVVGQRRTSAPPA